MLANPIPVEENYQNPKLRVSTARDITSVMFRAHRALARAPKEVLGNGKGITCGLAILEHISIAHYKKVLCREMGDA
ncbi:hypothetical protein BDN70DRAFT_877001, partial [Pholiota conissans]